MKRSVFECDACGERHGHRMEMREVPLRHESGRWEEPTTETLHLCLDCGDLGIDDVMEVWDEFLIGESRNEVVGLRKEGPKGYGYSEQIALIEDLSVDVHGNVAIIEDAVESVEEHFLN